MFWGSLGKRRKRWENECFKFCLDFIYKFPRSVPPRRVSPLSTHIHVFTEEVVREKSLLLASLQLLSTGKRESESWVGLNLCAPASNVYLQAWSSLDRKTLKGQSDCKRLVKVL